MRTELCNKCFRPKHETAMMWGMPIVSCVEVAEVRYPMGIVLTGLKWECGCCKCPTPTALVSVNKETKTVTFDMWQK